MKVFAANVPTLLMERVEALEEMDHHGWRCIYLQLHDKLERFNEALRINFINRALVDILSKDDGYIYFCEDGDIIVLFEGALKPIVAKLSTHFGDLNPDQLRGQDTDSLFSFFDLSKHWEGFVELCHEKTIRVQTARRRFIYATQTSSAPRSDSVTA